MIDPMSSLNKMVFSHVTKETVDVDKPKIKHQKIYTYIIRNPKNNLTKIGRSSNPLHRIATLSTAAGSILMIISIIEDDIEKILHKKYSEYRVNGEWFNLPDEIIEEIKLL